MNDNNNHLEYLTKGKISIFHDENKKKVSSIFNVAKVDIFLLILDDE